MPGENRPKPSENTPSARNGLPIGPGSDAAGRGRSHPADASSPGAPLRRRRHSPERPRATNGASSRNAPQPSRSAAPVLKSNCRNRPSPRNTAIPWNSRKPPKTAGAPSTATVSAKPAAPEPNATSVAASAIQRFESRRGGWPKARTRQRER